MKKGMRKFRMKKLCSKWAGRLAAVLSAAIVMAAGGAETVFAGSNPINKVSVRVTSKLEAGSKAPNIEIDGSSVLAGEIGVTANNSKYILTGAEWVDKSGNGLKVADEPRMKVTLEPTAVSDDYFLASYKASNVSVSGGTFVSAKREGDALVVTLRVTGVKGEFDPPLDVFWNENNLGQARWEKPENGTGKYEVQLYKDGKTAYKLGETSAIQYNFYPYMTKAGYYSVRVRTIPSTETQKKYGKASEWVESGELQITERYVSDGKGQQSNSSKKGTDSKTGWVKEKNNTWIYRYPNGSLARGGWVQVDEIWYYFDMDGKMVTGWQQVDGDYYYLHNNGQMAKGWNKINGKWYYFYEEKTGRKPAGSMEAPGWQVINSYYYYFNEDGSMYTGWLQHNGKWYYLNTVQNSFEGVMFTGWILRDGKAFFADGNGELVYGWYEIDGNWYYFYPNSGEMARNVSIDGMWVNEDGIWRQEG